MRKHINATTAQARNKGLEGASPGTSASLIYTDHKGRTLEGRQPYPVRVYADGAYVGILNPGETIDTFAASRIDEMPVYKKGGKIKGSDGKACWKGYRFVGTKNGKDRCVKVMEDGTVVEQPDSGPEIVANPIDYTQYKHIPSSHFEIPTGEFTYNYRKYIGDDENGDPIFVNEERTGTHNPDWYSADFDPFEYYSSGEYEGMNYRETPILDYENNPYMKKNEWGDNEMIHPLVWDEDRLIEENRKRFNQSVINDIWNEDGTLKPEYEDKLGSKRYLRPFGPNYEDAPNAQVGEGRWASDWFEGTRSGWGKPGGDDSWMYNKEEGTWHTFVPNVGGEAWNEGRFQDLTEKELKKLYKVYKKYPGFGDISKSEFIDRYKSGDIFHPQVPGVEQEKAWIQTFEDKVQPFKQGEFDAQKDFFDGAISSDLYREKLIAQGYENVDEIISQREAALANANMQYESTAQNYVDEFVRTGGGDKSGYRKGKEGEYDKHINDVYSILDKRQIIYDLIDQGKIDISNLGKWDAHNILSMYNDYTPIGDEAAPTEHGFYTEGERDALFWSNWANKGIVMSDYLNSKINEGKTGSRAYVTSKDGKTIISPRQLQQLNIDLGGEGTTEELHSFLDEVSAHELGHQMGAVNASEKVPFGLNKNDQNTIHRLMEESGINLDDLNWHDKAAYERKADLDALRWKMYNTIGYDYRTTPMTKEILQEYKNYIKENPIPSLVNDRNFKFFKDDKLIEFNNTVADATDEIGGDDLPPTAQVRYGGPARYMGGGNIMRGLAVGPAGMLSDSVLGKGTTNSMINKLVPGLGTAIGTISEKGGPAKYQNAGNVISDVQIQSPYDIEMELIKNNFEKSFSKEDRDYINFINTRTPFRDETTTGDDPELFYLDLYNTELTAEELLEYYLWKDEMAYRRSLLNKTNIEEELYKLDMDLGAYDVQGWWKSGDYENTDTDGHGTDKWKKPNHPTFSNESKYAANYELPEGEEDTRSNYLGGTWSETGAYTPSIHNMHTNERLHWEFNREPHRPEHLYMGNDLIYNHQHFPMIYDFEKTKILDNYEDGGGVKKQEEIPQYIEEPLTAKMQEKLDKMYRDNMGVPQDLELNTFDTSTEKGMMDYLKHTENSIMKGYNADKDRWYPHDDGEGNWTIGYGHHIGAHVKDTGYNIEDLKKNGLSSAEVDDLLKMDMKRESDLIAKNVPEWENLDTRQKNALLDIQFNISGNVWTKFENFTKAVVNKDWQNVVIEGSRAETAKNPDGTFKPNQRNTAFYKSMVEPMMNEWRPKIKNPNYVEEIDWNSVFNMQAPAAVQDNTYVDIPIFNKVEIDKIKKFEDGSEVNNDPPTIEDVELESDNTRIINREVDLGWDIQPFFSNTLIETQSTFPNYSDQEMYSYYLENKNPEEGMSIFIPNITTYPESNNLITPVPFYSSNFSTQLDSPNLYRETGTPCASNGQLIDGCAGGLQISFEYNTRLSKDQVRNVNGIKGNAWQMHQNVVDAGGQSLFNYSNLLGIDEDWRDENYTMNSDDLFYEFNKARNSYNPNDISALEASLEVGDLVDILYHGSSYQAEAIQDGFGSNINSHVGKITEKDGQLYVTHNIKGKWYSDRLDNVLKNQRYSGGGKMMIVGGYRPKYESGLIDGLSYKSGIENPVDGYNSLVSMDYMNHLGMTMPSIQDDFNFSDNDSSLVARASFGTFGRESTFATGPRWHAKNYTREMLRSYKGLNDATSLFGDSLPSVIISLLDKKFTDGTLNMDAPSEGMTQVKLDNYLSHPDLKVLFEAYQIDNPDILYTTEGSSRAAALVHSLNLKLINDYFSNHNLSDQVKMNMMHMAFNKGMGNVIKDFINEEGIITPTSFEKGHEIYKNIHTNEGSYSYLPNKISNYINYDHSKMKANANFVANYDVETLSGFEEGYMDLVNDLAQRRLLFEQKRNETRRNINKNTQKVFREVDRLIKKANKTKDIKYVTKGKGLLGDLMNLPANVNQDLKKETKTVKRGLKKIKSLFR